MACLTAERNCTSVKLLVCKSKLTLLLKPKLKVKVNDVNKTKSTFSELFY